MNAADRIQRRYQRISEIGCICCRQYGMYDVPCMVHHLNLGEHAGQVRMGDEYTIGLCPWHHVGHALAGLTVEQTCERIGPSLAHEPVRFRAVFGNDLALLAYENELIERAEARVVGRVAT